MNLSYEQKLQVVTKIILDDEARACDAPPCEEELGLKATLKPHQVEGVSWLIRRYKLGVNVVLVVICPLSVTEGWVLEIVKFTPKLTVLKYVGDKENRCNLRMKIREHVARQSSTMNVLLPFDVLLTSYDIALVDQDFLSQIPWQYAIIDEAQRLKNPSSVLFNILKDRYIMPRRLLMTGTPIQNNLSELWALMYFCMPSVFGTLDQFLSTFKDISDLSSVHDAPKVKERLNILRSILGAFMLRRTKSKLIECGNLVLPPLTETTVLVPLVILQKKVYISILRKELHKLLALSSGTSNHQSLQNIVIQLRKACSHPYLFPGIEPEPYEEGEHLVQASGKLLILDQLLQKLHYSGHRVLLFAQMTHTLDILQDFLELRKYSYERLDGSIRAEERFAAIRSFSSSSATSGLTSEAEQNGAFVFMISTRAGGVGLNLVAADTVIFYEQDWNPQVDKQALQRAHRIGQMNHVLCINLVTEKTVEEVIMRRAERKLLLSINVTGDNIIKNNDEETSEVGTGDLKSIIFGLHMLNPTEITDGNHRDMNLPEISVMADKVLALRDKQIRNTDDRKFEVNPRNILQGDDVKEGGTTFSHDLGLDEASYLSWVTKFEEVSKSSCNSMMDWRSKRNSEEEKSLKLESARKKAEEKKLSRWKALGYQSLSVKEPLTQTDNDITSATGSVHFLYGDCTTPSNVCSSEPAMIFSCVDTSGHWGHGGMFDALSKLSTSIGDAYERASEHGDLHLGDLHLIRLDDGCEEQDMNGNTPKMVALAVVQSYNLRRKIPRSEISLPHLESCLSKAAFSAAQNSASIHMPRIGYQDGSDRSEWYTIERLLRKYASIYNINIYV
ncbi:SWI/SNF-related matrix-associated actin-dependent regulator of chromatin subfamily A member 5 [Vigna unguiculata]|uniref:SWI/SNF-related matrix-associated actin-dependent regulator of chromatin subfamily A member 5 n=1 Tax=Vigna unguiculata TaxID=3917 RepID=A0A4D6NAM7_VIGUN|nr:SWI/SNF-related matrix-associated actin-dependent regulator of chromatin subfamily A member 5 [Vigna unguiculata]